MIDLARFPYREFCAVASHPRFTVASGVRTIIATVGYRPAVAVICEIWRKCDLHQPDDTFALIGDWYPCGVDLLHHTRAVDQLHPTGHFGDEPASIGHFRQRPGPLQTLGNRGDPVPCCRRRLWLHYGWPIVSHGIDYPFARVSPFTRHEGFEGPEVVWSPSIAPSGLAIYQGDPFKGWQGDFLVPALRERSIRRLVREGDRVVRQERLLAELGERIRDVRVASDGSIYVLTDGVDGRLLRLVATNPSPPYVRSAE